MSLRDDLDNVATLIEQGWTRGVSARRSDGHPVHPKSNEACAWCLYGALYRVKIDLDYHAEALVLEQIRLTGWRGHSRLTNWNDAPGRTQAEVVALVRAAARACEDGQ